MGLFLRETTDRLFIVIFSGSVKHCADVLYRHLKLEIATLLKCMGVM